MVDIYGTPLADYRTSYDWRPGTTPYNPYTAAQPTSYDVPFAAKPYLWVPGTEQKSQLGRSRNYIPTPSTPVSGGAYQSWAQNLPRAIYASGGQGLETPEMWTPENIEAALASYLEPYRQPVTETQRYQMSTPAGIQEQLAGLMGLLPSEYEYIQMFTPEANRVPVYGDWYTLHPELFPGTTNWRDYENQQARIAQATGALAWQNPTAGLGRAGGSPYGSESTIGMRAEMGQWEWLRDQIRRMADVSTKYAPGGELVGTRRTPEQQREYEREMAALFAWDPSDLTQLEPYGGKPENMSEGEWAELLLQYRAPGAEGAQIGYRWQDWLNPVITGVPDPSRAGLGKWYTSGQTHVQEQQELAQQQLIRELTAAGVSPEDIQKEIAKMSGEWVRGGTEYAPNAASYWETMQPWLKQMFLPETIEGGGIQGAEQPSWMDMGEPPPRRKKMWETGGTGTNSWAFQPRWA